MSGSGPSETRFLVGTEEGGLRIDRWLAERIEGVSRSQIQAWIRDGRIRVGEVVVPARYVTAPGDRILVQVPEARVPTLAPVDVPFHVVHEDEDVVIVDKPAGLQVHPGSGPSRPTLVHGLLHRYPGWSPPGPPDRPGIVHRLDRGTSGLLVVGRSARGYLSLSRQIRERTVSRRYLALVWGHLSADSGRIEAPIGRHARDRTRMAVRRGGRPAATRWRVLLRLEHLTWVEARLETGRTHQIRVHFAHLGHPIFADPTYGRDAVWAERIAGPERALPLELARRLNRQALHAYHLDFDRPTDGRRVRCESPVPRDLEDVLAPLMEKG